MGRFVSDLNVLTSYRHTPAGEAAGYEMPVHTPTGWVKVDTDLNTHASGDYVYFVFEKCAQDPPITGIRILKGDDPVPEGFQKILVDLNRGAGGAYLHAAVSREQGPKTKPVEDLMIVNWDPHADRVPPLAGYSRIDVDLNEGTGGDHIYLDYKPAR
jgi:hypothetical protein